MAFLTAEPTVRQIGWTTAGNSGKAAKAACTTDCATGKTAASGCASGWPPDQAGSKGNKASTPLMLSNATAVDTATAAVTMSSSLRYR